MNAELDNQIKFKYHQDKLDAVKALGYTYISEAMIDLYVNQKMSMQQISNALNNEITKEAIGRWLKIWGVKARSKGGDTSNYVEIWGENCIYCHKSTEKYRRLHGGHQSCCEKFKRGTKNWAIKYTKSAEGLTRLKKDFGIAQSVDDQLLISVLSK